MNIIKYKNNFKLYDKYSWVGRYHNYFCENFLGKIEGVAIDDVKIDETLLQKNIKRIVIQKSNK